MWKQNQFGSIRTCFEFSSSILSHRFERNYSWIFAIRHKQYLCSTKWSTRYNLWEWKEEIISNVVICCLNFELYETKFEKGSKKHHVTMFSKLFVIFFFAEKLLNMNLAALNVLDEKWLNPFIYFIPNHQYGHSQGATHAQINFDNFITQNYY